MNKINQLFQPGDGRKLLSLYFCAGSPTLEGTAHVILTLQRRGIDMVEVGIPFSDPLADGPVIQQAGTEALANGITLAKIFEQLGGIRGQVDIPLVLMGYLNVVERYGLERFFRDCVATGVSGCIIPDLPFEEAGPYREIMKDGIIQQIGTPQEVFDHPANLFVAGFIGTPQMNFYDAELVRENGRYAVVLENARVELSEDKQANLERNQVAPQPITLGVRPEHISLAADASRAVHGTVDVAEMMGSAVHLHVNACGSDTIIILQTMELHDEGREIPTIGSALDFTFGGNVCHLFDRNTGRTLEQSAT